MGQIATVFHIEDDALWTDAVARMIARWPDFRYVGSATAVGEGLVRCKSQAPDIILLDLLLSDADGLRHIEDFVSLADHPRLIIITCRTDEFTLYRAWNSGISGMIWKNPSLPQQLSIALSAAIRGRRYFPSDIHAALNRFRSSGSAFYKLLSAREIELIEPFARGWTDAQIGSAFFVSPSTIHSHRHNIMVKLGLHTKHELMLWAIQKGFADPRRTLAFAECAADDEKSPDI